MPTLEKRKEMKDDQTEKLNEKKKPKTKTQMIKWNGAEYVRIRILNSE